MRLALKNTAVAVFLFIPIVCASVAARQKLVLFFYGSSTCGECQEIREKLLEPLQESRADSLKVVFKDIENETDVKLLTIMEHDYNVSNPAPQELFFPDTVLEGYDDIMRLAKVRIEQYLANPAKLVYHHSYGELAIDTVGTAVKQAHAVTWTGFLAAVRMFFARIWLAFAALFSFGK